MKKTESEKVVYLLDLAHTQSVEDTSLTVPLGIGYIAAYLNKNKEHNINIKLFKHPEKALENIITDKPSIIGIANYGWNHQLNIKIGKYIRKILPDSLIVAGGPNIDSDKVLIHKFLTEFSFLDYIIINGGEESFSELTAWHLDKLDNTELPENLVWLHNDTLKSTPTRKTKKCIENIPSPYLSGYLDSFLEMGMIPLLETNRGCPFKCTFCAWGMASHDLVRRFEMETVIKEIEYVGARSSSRNWIFCDANFGILARDVDIAKAIMKNNKTYGYPASCHMWLSKNTLKRNLEIVEIMGDLIVPCMAVQSMDKDVLKHIKRDNIKLETYTEYQEKFHNIGSITYSDMIVPLPVETLDSHINGIEHLMTLGVDIIMNHNMRLLAGAETNSLDTRNRYNFKTKYRLIHGDAGKYKTPDNEYISSFEYEESLRSTNSMSEKEVFYLRKLHFLIDFSWNLDVYKPLLKLLISNDISPITLFKRIILIEDSNDINLQKIKCFWTEFTNISVNEWFDSAEDIESHFANNENFDKLINQEYEKLNISSSVKILKDLKKEFDEQFLLITKELLPSHHNITDDIMHVISATFPSLDELLDSSEVHLSKDIITAINEGFSLSKTSENEQNAIRFIESDKRKNVKSIIVNSKGKTLSKILNSQLISLSDLKLSIDESFGYGREAKRYFQPHN